MPRLIPATSSRLVVKRSGERELRERSIPKGPAPLCPSTERPLASVSRGRQLTAERAASWLSKQLTYRWLGERGHGRCLIDKGDLRAGDHALQGAAL